MYGEYKYEHEPKYGYGSGHYITLSQLENEIYPLANSKPDMLKTTINEAPEGTFGIWMNSELRVKYALRHQHTDDYPLTYSRRRVLDIWNYPLAEVWLSAAGQFALEKEKLMALFYLWNNAKLHKQLYKEWFVKLFDGFPFRKEAYERAQIIQNHIIGLNGSLEMSNQLLLAILNTDIVTDWQDTQSSQGSNLFNFAFSVYVNLVKMIPGNRLSGVFEEIDDAEKYARMRSTKSNTLSADELAFWRRLAYDAISSEDQFKQYFNEMWYQSLAAKQGTYYDIGYEDIFFAHHLGLLSDDALMHFCRLICHKCG
jgi:hypothetical protein